MFAPSKCAPANSVIKDIGTAFDVFRAEHETLVTVIEGQVTVRDMPASSAGDLPYAKSGEILPVVADLHAGDQAILLPSGAVQTKRASTCGKPPPGHGTKSSSMRRRSPPSLPNSTAITARKIVVERPTYSPISPISGVFHTYDLASFVQFLNGLAGVKTTLVGEKDGCCGWAGAERAVKL